MPTIPKSASVSLPGIPAPSTTMMGEIQRGFSALGRQAQQFANEYTEDQKRNEFISLSGELDRSLMELQLEIERDPSITTAADSVSAFTERAKPIVEEIGGNSRWKSVHTALLARSLSAISRGSAALSRTGYAKEVEHAKATLLQSEETYAQEYARSETDKDRAAAMSKMLTALGASPYIDDLEEEKWRQRFEERAVTERALHLANSGRVEEARKFIKGENAASVLNEQQVYHLNATFDATEARLEREQKTRLKEAGDVVKNAYVERIFGVGEPISIPEIMASPLDPKDKEHYAELYQTQSLRPELDKDNPALVKRLIQDISAGVVTDPTQLHTYLMNGLSRSTEGILENRIGEMKKPGEQELQKLIDEHFKSAEREIYGTLFKNDPAGAPKFNRYFFDKTEELRQMREAGASLAERRRALNPSDPTYIGKDISRYKVRIEDSMDSALEQLGPSPETGEIPKPPPNYPDAVWTFRWDEEGNPIFRLPDGREGTF